MASPLAWSTINTVVPPALLRQGYGARLLLVLVRFKLTSFIDVLLYWNSIGILVTFIVSFCSRASQ